MTDHTDLIARLRDFAEETHANRCPADAVCTCGHDVSRVALAHEAATALEALARENAELREAATWRPIETAPKDGGEVITCREISPHLPVQIGTDSYIVNGPGDQGWLIGTRWWQPFPAPPDGGEGG